MSKSVSYRVKQLIPPKHVKLIRQDSDPDGIDSDSGSVDPGGPETNSDETSPHPSGSSSGSDVDEEVNPGGVGSNSDGNESGSEIGEGTAGPSSGGTDSESESKSEGKGAPPGGNNTGPGDGEEVNPGGVGSNSGEGSVSPGAGSDTASTDPGEDNSDSSEGNASGDDSDPGETDPYQYTIDRGRAAHPLIATIPPTGTISAPAPMPVPETVPPIGGRHTSDAHGNFSIKNDSTFSSTSGTHNSTSTNKHSHFDSNESNRNCGKDISLGTLVWNSPDHGYEGVQPHCRPYHVRGYPPKDLYLDFDGNIIFNKPRPSPPKIDSEGRIPIPDY
ncbi:hypothetical protein TWF191_000962 [Orbilia oligospora]|uniref:Uncharacterized protein n=1 Tax=Orbilia oligospora TaxID=2813651 RepID=A0A7C8QDC1_ORBOL|nr:hypothetical protein TWF191_000962 [Orbilia oligospora]